jgi:hypothetical protein
MLPFRRFVLPAIVLNSLITMGLTVPLFTHGARGGGLLLALLPYAANAFMTSLLLGLLAWLLSAVFRHRAGVAVAGVLFTAFQCFVLVDTNIYRIYRFHMNAIVWNLLMTEGAGDSVAIGAGTVWTFAAIALAIALAEAVVIWFIVRSIRLLPDDIHRVFMRTAAAAALLLLGVLVADKAVYAYGDLMNRIEITQNSKLYLLYQPLTVKRFVNRHFGVSHEREEGLAAGGAGGAVQYPRGTLDCSEAAAKGYNIVLLVVEGLRFDMLDEETMPHLSGIGREEGSLVMRRHYSGGNASRFGVFSLLYGLHGTYWHTFLANRVPPVLMTRLLELGYEIDVLSSTKLTYPEFRRTAFVQVPERIRDEFPREVPHDRRDLALADDFISDVPDGEGPFFSFVFFNASHQTYYYPPGFEHFRPASGTEINYFTDMDSGNSVPVRNRYRNAVRYDDFLIGRMADALKAAGVWDRTIFVVAGDHGEEFHERGFVGHTSSFNDYQASTVFVMHHPDVAGAREVTRLTSHADLVPTLMPALGCMADPKVYSQGLPLIDGLPASGRARAAVAVANWDTAAVMDGTHTVEFSTEAYNMASFRIYETSTHEPVADQDAVLRQMRPLLVDFTRQMAEFYQ